MSLCADCKWAKDHFKESCYCTYYGYIRFRGRDDCWGYEKGENNHEQTDNHRKPDAGSGTAHDC